MQKSLKVLKNGDIVQIFNNLLNNYIISDKKTYQKGVKEDFVGCSPLQNDDHTFWQIELRYAGIHSSVKSEKYKPKIYSMDDEIQFGDIVAFKNVLTKNYLSVEDQTKKKKPTNHQVFCAHQKADQVPLCLFIISRDENPFDPKMNNINTKIFSDTPINLVNIMNLTKLASHSQQYKQNEIAEFREVFGSPIKVQGCSWTLKTVQNTILRLPSQEESKVADQKQVPIILDKKLIVIRNLQNGNSLHSHGINYKKGSKQQEVTAKEQTRDSNDFWQIIIYRNQNLASSQSLLNSGNLESSSASLRMSQGQVSCYLSVNSQFTLIHHETNKMLTHIDGMKSCSHSQGLEVCCTENQRPFDEWTLEALNEDQSRISLNEPFLIKHRKTNQYLISTEYSSSAYNNQQEVTLSDKLSPQAIWCIESMANC